MKMKKLFLGVSFFSLLVLGACEKGIPNIDKTDYFKEYSFDTKATKEQTDAIVNGINSGVYLLSSVSIKTEAYEKSNLIERYETGDSKIKILEDKNNLDHLIKERTTSSDSLTKSNGTTVKQSEKSVSTEWDAGGGKIYYMSKRTTNGSEEETASYTPNSSGSIASNKDRKMDAIKQLIITGMSDFNASSCYANKDGSFTCVATSQVSRSVTAVEWGTSTKEYIRETRSQAVSFFDKDYRLTKYYSYQEATTNRDASTGEWYDSVKLVAFTYRLYEYHYGNRESASISELTKKADSIKTRKATL